MISIEVKDMTCGHCESTLRKAIAAVDESAKVNVDLAAHRLDIESTADLKHLIEAVRKAGYSAGSLEDMTTTAPGKSRRGCCCS